MMKLSKTGIGLLTNQYRSVLRKCFLINAGLFLALAPVNANAEDVDIVHRCPSWGGNVTVQGWYDTNIKATDCYFKEKPTEFETVFKCTKFGCGYYQYWSELPDELGPYQEGDEGYGIAYTNPEAAYAAMSDAEKAAALKYDAKYAVLNSNGAYVRATYSVAENIAALDAQVAANTSTIAAHTAVINALDNNYYRKLKISSPHNALITCIYL